MVFYILMLVQLVLIGGAFFLWFQMKNEVAVIGPVMAGAATGVYSDGLSNSSFVEPKSKEEMNSGLDDAEWSRFGVQERKKQEKEDFSDMDRMLGFEDSSETANSKNFGEFDDFSDEKPEVRKPSIEEEFADLFTDDELQDDRGLNSMQVGQSVNDFMSSDSDFLDDFGLDNSPTFSNGFKEAEEPLKNKMEQDPLDFLRNYQFAEPIEESLTDDIFEQARNKKEEIDFNYNHSTVNNSQDDGLIFEDEDLDIDLMKRSLPPLDGINQRSDERGIVLEPTPRAEDEEEDIFARFQSLQRMTDNMDDLR